MADLVISTLEELKSFRDEVNAGNTFAGKTVELAANIDLMSEEWTPIGNNTNKFQGTFDGKGYTVSNLVITGNNSNAGFFGFTESGAIKNLTIDNASVSGYLNVGVVAGTPYTSTYSNIKLTGVIKVDGYAYVGGMFGKNLYADASDLVIEASDDSYVKASSEFYRTYVGGIVGFMGEGPHTVQNVTSNINVEGSTCDVGGIAGIAHYENIFINVTCTAKKVVLVNAQDEGDHLEVGGIAGVWHNDSGRTVQMINCNVEGTELKSSLNGVEQDVSGNITTGRQYNASSTGSLLVGNQTSSDEMTWTVSGPNAQTDLANLLGMDPSELIADEKGNYTVQASIDTSVLYVNSAWTGTADGQFVTTPDGVKLRFGTNAFGSFQTLTSLYGSKDSSNTETQKISFIGNDTYSGNAKQFLYTGRDLLLTTDDAGGATIEWTVPRLYLMNVYSIVNGQGAPDPAQMPTVTIGKDVSLVINPASGNDGILMVGQNIDSPDDLDADGNPTRDPGAINLVIDGTVTARLYIANYSNVTVSNTGKVFKGKEAFIMRGKSTMSVTGNNDGAAQLTANYTQMSGGTLTLTDTRMETGRFSLSYDAKSLEGAREGATLNMANSTVAGSGDLIIDAQSKVTATDNSLLSLKNSVDNSGILSLESGSSLVAASAVNAGTVSIDNAALTAGTLVNNSTVNVSGADSAVKAVFSGSGSTVFTDVVLDADWAVSGSQGEWRFLGDSTVAQAMVFGGRVYAGTLQTADETDFSGVASSTLAINADFSASALWIGAQYADGITDSKTSTVTVNSGSVLTVDGESSGLVIRESGILNVIDGSSLKIGHDRQVMIQGALTVDGAGSLFETASSPVNIYKDHAVLTVSNGGKAVFGSYNDTNIRIGTGGEIVLKSGILVLNDTLNINDTGSFSMDYLSTVSFAETINVAATASLTIDTTGFTGGVYKLMDYTGTGAYSEEQYKVILGSNWDDAYYSVIDSDLYLMNVDMTTVKVDAAWAGSEFGAKVAEGYYYGINAFSSVQNAADAVTAAVQTINVADAVYDTTKFTKSVNLTGTATFDLTKSESFMFFTDGVSAASYEIASGTVITAPSLSLRAEDASENYVDGLTVSVLCNGTVNLSGASASDAAREIWVRKNTTLTVAEGGSVNGATQLSNRGIININGVISGVSIQGNGAMMLAGQQNSNGTFTGGVMNIDGGELSVSGVRTISGGNSLMITDKNATAASEKGIVNLTNGGKITAADSEMYIGLSGELNIGEAASVTVSRIENNGVINVTGTSALSTVVSGNGEFNILGGTEDAPTRLSGKITSDDKDTDLTLKEGTILLGADADISLNGYEGDVYSEFIVGGTDNTTTDVTDVTMSDGAKVSAQRVWIGGEYDKEKDTAAHTLNVTGSGTLLNGHSQIGVNIRRDGVLNVSDGGEAKASDLVVRGTITVDNAKLTANGGNVYGEGNNIPAVITVENKGVFTASGTQVFQIGHASAADRTGVLNVKNGSIVTVNNLKLEQSGSINMDYTSTLAFDTFVSSGTITVDTAGFTSGVYKIFDDLTGSYTETEYRSLLGDANWNDSYKVIDNDLYLTNLEGAELYVDSAWASMSPNEEVTFVDGTKAYYKLNAFDTVANALALPSGETAYENAVKLNITGAVKSNISVIGSNITEVNSAARTADENAVIAEDALTVNLVQVDNTEAGWEVYYPLAAGSAASVYGGITTNFVSGLFTFETTRDPNIIGGAYGASDAKIYGSTTVNIGTDGGADSDVDIYVDALVGSGGGTVNGNSSVNIYSGTIDMTGSIIGGSSWGGVVKGDSSVNIYGGTITDSSDGKSKRGIMGGSYNGVTEGNASVNIYGGTVNGRIYAGGSQAGTTVKGNASVNISDGVVNGSIYGTGGVVEGSISISVAGGTVNGDIYAGGYNAGAGNTSIDITGGSVSGNIYGGSFVDASSSTVNSVGDVEIKIENLSASGSRVFGGGKTLKTGVLEADMTEGDAVINIMDNVTLKSVHGGTWVRNYTSDDAQTASQAKAFVKSSNITIDGASSTVSKVFGGGMTSGNGTGALSTVGSSTINLKNGSVGELYGGGWANYFHSTAIGSEDGTATDDTLVRINISGGSADYVYGGGLADVADFSADGDGGGRDTSVNGSVEINISGGSVGEVYGGGFANSWSTYDERFKSPSSTVTGNVAINISGGTVIGDVCGGGNTNNFDSENVNVTSVVNGNVTVTITGGTVTGDIYGGGKAEATVNGSRTLNLGSADAATYAATLNNAYDFNVVQIVNADVTVTGDFYAEEINIAEATLTLNSGFKAATTAVTIEVGAYNVAAAALNVGVSGVNQPSITISAAEELTAGRYLVASGFDSLSGFTVDGINGYTLRLQGEDVYLTKDLAPDDYDANGRPDILMLHDIGKLQVGLVQEDQSVTLKDVADLGDGWTILGSGQSGNGENYADIYLTNGETVGIWQLDETTGVAAWQEIQSFDSATHVLGLGDFNGDGITDLLLQNDNGAVGAYHTSGENVGWNYFQSLGSEWSIAGIGDFNHDGIDDVVLQNEQGGYAGIWQLDRDGQVSWSDLDVLNNGQIAGTGDFNGDGFDDVLLKWGNSYGAWTVSGGNLSGWMDLGTLEDGTVLEQIGDFNGDGIDDLRVRSANGDLGAVCVLGEGNLQWNYHFSVGSEWQTNLVSI